MAYNMEQETARRAATWNGFVVFLTASVVATAVVLGLMAVALL
jgi:hypothetical protein